MEIILICVHDAQNAMIKQEMQQKNPPSKKIVPYFKLLLVLLEEEFRLG